MAFLESTSEPRKKSKNIFFQKKRLQWKFYRFLFQKMIDAIQLLTSEKYVNMEKSPEFIFRYVRRSKLFMHVAQF